MGDQIYATTEYESSFNSKGDDDNDNDDITLLIVVLSVSLSILCIGCIALSVFRSYQKKKAETKKIVHNIAVESNEIGISKDLDMVTTGNDNIALPETKGMNEGEKEMLLIMMRRFRLLKNLMMMVIVNRMIKKTY